MKKGFKRFFKTALLSLVAVLCLSGCQKNASSEEFLEENRIVETTETETQSTEKEVQNTVVEKEEINYTYAVIPGNNEKDRIVNLNTGETVAKYDDIYYSSQSPYTLVRNHDKYGVINYITGEEFLSVSYKNIEMSQSYITAQKMDESYLIIDLTTGQRFELVKNEYFKMMKVVDSNYAKIYGLYETGIINWRTNEVKVEPYYDWLPDEISEDGFIVVNKYGQYGILDCNTGEEIIPTRYSFVYMEEHFAMLIQEDDEQYVCFDLKQRKELFKSQERIYLQKHYLAAKNGQKWFIKDLLTGDIIFEKECDFLIFTKNDNLAAYYIDGKVGVIDWKNNKEILPKQYEEDILYLNDTYATVQLEGKWGVIDYTTGEVLVNFDYDFVYPIWFTSPLTQYDEKYAYTRKNGKIGLINYYTGKELLEPIYDEINFIGDTFAEITIGEEKYVINYHTGEILEEINANESDLFIFPQSDKTES